MANEALQKIKPRPAAKRVVVCASGPSMPGQVWYARHAHLNGWFVIAVQDAWRLVPFAPMLYGCDAKWWKHHGPSVLENYRGERWSTHDQQTNQKIELLDARGEVEFRAADYGINLIQGIQCTGFSFRDTRIHYGSNSGFQAVNIALLLGAKEICLLGFDHRAVDAKRHFFGEHPNGWGTGDFNGWLPEWERGRRSLPDGINVYNCTPGSALNVFESRSPEILCEPSS